MRTSTATTAATKVASAATSAEGLDSPGEVLDFARWCRSEADRFEANLMLAAVSWAEQHPPESIDTAATWNSPAGDTGLLLAGPGAPLVSEFSIAEFALAIGRSTDSGRAYLATAVELKYRLPRTWGRVLRGDLPAWRARRVAEATFTLTLEAAGFVDAQVSAFAHKIGHAALERLVGEAINRFMPEQARKNAEKAAEGRHVSFHHDQVTFNGTTHLEGELDLADALDLDAALAAGAEQLKACGSEQSLDVRRAMAAGELARRQLALNLNLAAQEDEEDETHGGDAEPGTTTTTPTETTAEPARTAKTPKTVRPRRVVLYVHLSEAAITGTSTSTSTDLHLARVENRRQGVTADQVRGWCANPDTEVIIKPVIDLNEHIATGAYETPRRLEEQTQLRDETCVFPWCTRPAAACDNEHCIAYAPDEKGGPTCSCNVAPTCRRHHRLKTHSAWTYTTLEPGSFLWTSPHGYQFLRDEQGTLDVSGDRPGRETHWSDPPAPPTPPGQPGQPGPPGPQHFY